MSSDSLSAFSLKFSSTDAQDIKIRSIKDPDVQYIYQLCDQAILWALENKEDLLPLASPVKGSFKTYYISSNNDEKLIQLKDFWEVKQARALYSAIKHYLSNTVLELEVD